MIVDETFAGLARKPDPAAHLRILRQSAAVVAIDGEICAYIPLLEVLPGHQGRGIGRMLVKKMLDRTTDLHMVDLSCDEPPAPLYERLGFARSTAMTRRRYDRRNAPAAGSRRA